MKQGLGRNQPLQQPAAAILVFRDVKALGAAATAELCRSPTKYPAIFMVIDETQPRPSAQDAASRLVVLKFVVVYAITAAPRDMLGTLLEQWSAEDRAKFNTDAEAGREEFWQPLRQAGLWTCVSPSEQELSETTIVTMEAHQQVNASWRMESAQVLMWALGMVPHLPPYDTQANHDLLKQIPSGDIARFISSARLRKDSEVDRARDDAELWHWRSRTRQLIEEGEEFPTNEQSRAAGFSTYDDIVRFTARKLAGENRIPTCIEDDFPAYTKAYRNLSAEEWSEVRSVTMERHFALNWLCGYAPDNQWDETPTDT
jgi:hypothetical protein